jgi:hypothetical protein
MTTALAGALVLPVTALADDAPVPRYTYVGAGLEWTDSKCTIESQIDGADGYTAEASLGVLDFLHFTGSYFDGEADGSNDQDVTCYEIGIGLSYRLAASTDIVLRGHYVNAELDNDDEDGFEPELLVRHMISNKTEIQFGAAYFDVGSENNTEVRAVLVHNLRPWLALRAGGSVFDNDSSFFAGVRFYLGDNLF